MKKPLIVIFFTVFIYLLGFGMIIPVLPLLSIHYGATAWEAGLLMSSYSLMQFVFAPFWGKLSDRYGRRPILLFCLFGEVISYLVLASSRSLEMLFVARILTGFFGASISTASAYVSDVTTQQDRSKGMALIGAAFGLGFLFGPAIGGGLTVFAESISTDLGFIASFSSYGVALLCLGTFIFAYFNLTESISAEVRAKNSAIKSKRISNMLHYFKTPVISPLITGFALTTLSMAMMEATLVLYMKDRFNWSIKEVSFGFAYIGVIIVFTQGYLVRKLIPRFGEKNLLRVGLFLMAVGFVGIGLAESIPMMGVVMTFLSLGNGLTNPAILGSVSLLVPAEEQGVAMGTTQSLSALGRVIGPAVGGFLFQSAAKNSPFLLAGGLTFFALSIVYMIYQSLPDHGKKVVG
ncbi:MAG: MFS transporter [Bdellovibrionota bacterium]